MENLKEVIYKALIAEYGEDFVEKDQDKFFISEEDSNLGFEVALQVIS
jgi:hypothetical protein